MKKKIIWSIVAVLLVCLIGVGVWFAMSMVSIDEKPEQPVVEEKKEETPVDLAQVEADIAKYKEIVMTKPQDVEASVGLIKAFGLKGDVEAARTQADRIASLVPTDMSIYDAMLDIYMNKEDYISAALYIDNISVDVKGRYEKKLREEGNPLYTGFGNTPGNIVNGGYVCVSGDHIYYSERMDGKALYKADLDGKNKVKLSDVPARDINVVGDTVYFVHNDRFVIHSVKTDGSDAKELILTMAKCMAVFGDRLYYINWGDDCQIYSAKLDGTDVKLEYPICASEFAFAGPWIYYSEHNNGDVLARIRIDGEEQSMFDDQASIFVNNANGYTYYVNWNDEGKLYKYAQHGQEMPGPITESKVGYVNLQGDWIYYIDWINGESTHRINLSTNEIERITKDACDGTYVTDEYVYYYNSGDGKRLYRMELNGKHKTLIGK